jgi:ElaB/YqjD/DUF883 family membrane-anchored ribosome-binding protein
MASRKAGAGIKKEARRVKADVEDVAEGAADAAHSGVDELREGAERAVAVVKDKLEEAKGTAIDATHTVRDFVTRNPLASVGIAAATGLLLGLAMRRPRS